MFSTLLARVEVEHHRSRQLAVRLGSVLYPNAITPVWMRNGLTFRFDFDA
jgi:hypothetical protein